MAKKRRKKASAKVCVSRTALNKVISMGAGHHAAIAQLKRTVKTVPARKTRKKATKKRAKKRSRRR